MKKNLFFLLLGCMVAFSACGQQKSIDAVMGVQWLLSQETMSGIGHHKSLPKNTRLLINPDHRWRASAPIDGATEGSWSLSGQDAVTVFLGEDKKAELRIQEDGSLRMVRSGPLQKRTIIWTREGR